MALSRDQVAAAAITVADAEGLDALTMRRVGRALGVEAMSLYRYVSGKEDLLDAVHQRLLAELPPPGTGDWSAVLEAQATAFRGILAAHRQLVPLFATRPARADAETHIAALRVRLTDAGFDDREAGHAFQLVFAFVVGHAMFHFAHHDDTPDAVDEFRWGLATVVTGLAVRRGQRPSTKPKAHPSTSAA